MTHRLSQNDRVLAVLADGREHSVEEIHRLAGTMRLNSRIAELRSKRGLSIVCHKGGGDYRYQLIGPLAESSSSLPAAAAAVDGEFSASGVDLGLTAPSVDAVPSAGGDAAHLQLSLGLAA